MVDKDKKRISRLTAILTLLQSKRLIKASYLAKKYHVSTRTIYRDIRALEQAGVPIITEEGRGFSIVEGYRIPPVMFTEREALAIITAENIIVKQTDASFKEEFANVVTKIKSVLRHASKENLERLEQRIFVGKNFNEVITSSSLMDIQLAIVKSKTIKIDYKVENEKLTTRIVEPYMLYNSKTDKWTVLAYCRFREDFRTFRLDRIKQYLTLPESFEPDEQALKKYIKENYLS